MKLCEISIKNFYCIGNDGVRVKIDDIVVLIGPNNVGKTTVLNAYALFTESGSPQPISAFFNNDEENPIEICGVFSEINPHDIELIGRKWIFDDPVYGNAIRYKWVWNKANTKGEKYSWDNEASNWIPGGMGGWDTKIASCIPIPLRISPFDQSTEMETKIIEILTNAVKESLKTDATRISKMIGQINSLAEEVKTEITESLNQTTSRVAKNLFDIFPGHKVDIQPGAGKFEPEKIIASGTQVMITKDNGGTYPLSNQGSGLQRTFLWSAIEALSNSGVLKLGRRPITNENPRILLVEEPESFLHPPAIRMARESLYRISELSNWQVMITTHSPIFIDVSKPHTTIVRVDRCESIGTRTFSTDQAGFAEEERLRLQMIRSCHPTVNEFFFSDKAILVEGETEQVVFNNLSKGDSKTTVVNCFGKANIPMFQKILNHFHINYIVVHDLDSPKCKRDGNYITNSMWTMNERIFTEATKEEGNIVIVNIPDFEGQYFNCLQKGDKPYNAIIRINEPIFRNSNHFIELVNISNLENLDKLSRVVTNVGDYTTHAKEYSSSLTEEIERWEI